VIRLLTFTSLYPSEGSPRHGIFVEQRLRRLVETREVCACVMVPFPRRPGETSLIEPTVRHDIPVRYFPFPFIRGVTTPFHPTLMARAARKALASLRAVDRDFDLVDGQFLYPDGVAAARFARWLGKPVVLTARGSDVNVALGERVAGRSIRRAVSEAAALIAVSAALRDRMVERGLPGERITVIRNGVDLELFKPGDRASLRTNLGFDGPTLLSVGNLVPEKGQNLVLQALAQLPSVRLVMLGQGPEEGRLRTAAINLGVAPRVRWLMPVPQDQLARYYGAADLTVLASTREGMPNVLLESLACGTPVVATAVGGVPEVVTDPVAGRLVATRSAEALAAACRELLDAPPPAAEVRRFGERYGWQQPIAAQLALYQRVAGAA
jgi:glycosyltransferase involved in cell wall biosynthesis